MTMKQLLDRKTRFTIALVFALFLIACDFNGQQKESAGNSETTTAVDSESGFKENKIQLSSAKKNSHIYLGTGSVQGVYFPIGGVICRLLNRKTYVHRIRCTLESTGGSIYNLRQLRENNFDVVFAQSDWQYNAYHGKSTFEKETPNPDLRAVFALEADPLALIVQKDSDIREFNDLQDRVVSFGYARALQHRVIDDLLEVKGWTEKNFKKVRRMSIIGNEIDNVIEQKPYYRKSIIAKGDYLDSPKDIESFGLGATFVALEKTSPKAVYHIVKEVVENFNDFKSLHPSLKSLSKKELPYAGISIPLHSGAIRYYKEAGLLK